MLLSSIVPARQASANTATTGESLSGVVRNYVALPPTYVLPTPPLVDLAAEQYRAAIMLPQKTESFLAFAAETANFAPTRGTTLQISFTQTPSVIVTVDADGRQLEGTLYSLRVQQGQTKEIVELAGHGFLDPRQGTFTITDPTTLALLGGGLFESRGDRLISSSYILAAATFWWTKNDAVLTRFQWDGRLGRWRPTRGGAVRLLGPLAEEAELLPLPSWLHVGDFLPGDSGAESYAILRLQTPGGQAIAEPAVDGFGGVLVVEDTKTFSFDNTTHAGVVSLDGTLLWNPSFVEARSGTPIWYGPPDLDDSGIVGTFGEELHLAPVPGPLETPLLRIGSRRWLKAFLVNNDTALGQLVLSSGQVGVSATTGKLRFAADDLAALDPLSPLYDASYLGESVTFDGLAFGREPVPLREALPLVDKNELPAQVGAEVYLPLAQELAPGSSGMLAVPDGTGITPVLGPIGARPLGSGLRHEVEGFWGLSLFTETGTISEFRVVNTMDDVPNFPFQIPRGTAYIVRSNRRVVLGRQDLKRFDGEMMFFRQDVLTPSIALPDARLWSRQQYWFSLQGTERLVFAINGVKLTWDASLNAGGIQTNKGGVFSAEELAASFAAVVLGIGEAHAIRGHLVLAPLMTNGNYNAGDVEIGIGNPGVDPSDLSGSAALGFLPGWRSGFWIFDHGASLGLFETVVPGAADVNATVRVDELLLADKVPASPFVLLQQIPLQEIAGYEPRVFFRLQLGKSRRLLQPLVDVLYDFDQNRIAFLQSVDRVETLRGATTTLGLVGPTTRRVLEAPGNGLRIARPGENFLPATYGTDYRLVTDPGNALLLIHEVGRQVLTSDTGVLQGSVLTDPEQDFALVAVGMQLQVQSEVRTITQVAPTSLQVTPAFTKDGRASYSIFQAPSEGILLASQYEVFSPLPEEPFRLRLLQPLGLAEEPLVAQGFVLGRLLSLRFGLPAESGGASIHLLTKRVVGVVGAELSLEEDIHVLAHAFHLELDGEVYSFEQGNLVEVAMATPDLLGDLIEVVIPGGILALGAGVEADHPEAQVIYAEDLLAPVDLPSGQAEMNAKTGQLSISAEDQAAHAGVTVYLVQRLRSQGGVDVTMNPIQGSLLLTSPMLPRQIVEAEYFQAVSGTGELATTDGAPNRVVEFLSLRILNERATPTLNLALWSFNPTGRTIDVLMEPAVRVGPIQCNIGNSLVADVRLPENVISFPSEQDPAAEVMISYSVLEAFGGEQSFTVSLPPVWRPPFRLDANTDRFTLLGDRTGDVVPGKLLRVGGTAFYITQSTFQDGNTLVVFTPPTSLPVGSLDPGSDSISATTDVPIRDRPELWLETTAPYAPVSRGALSLEFQGDLSWVVVGAALEIGGNPYLVAEVTAGETTTIGLTTFLERGFAFGEDAVRITRRPIYQPSPQAILGPGALDPEAPVTVVRLPLGGVGEVLTLHLDYEIEVATGNLTLRDVIPARTELYVRHTQLVSLAPDVLDGITRYPRVALHYGAITIPSPAIQKSSLLATYTFSNPDSFQYRVLPLDTYVGEIATTLSATSGLAGGPFLGGFVALTSSQEGLIGPRGDLATFRAQDQAVRRLIETYDGTIIPFEQVLETMSGGVIGDRDGKFKFFVGHTEHIAPPGYEDPFSGELVPHNIFGKMFASYRPDIFLLQQDPIVEPAGAALDGERLEGPFPDPELLSAWISVQRNYTRNDIDDVVLVGRTRKKVKIGPLRMEAFGRYRRMGEPHAFSRLFPERTLMFTQMDPGLGADLEAAPPNPGVYAFRKRLKRPSFENGILRLPKRQSTWGTTIGQVENPVLGQIENVSSLALTPRLPRARIVRYEPFGFPELDVAVVSAGGVPFTSQPRPAMIVSLLPLGEFPLDAQGNPDFALLAFLGGPIPDLTTGNPELFTPPWPALAPGILPKVSLGKPDGSLLDLATLGVSSFGFGGGSFTVPESVFVAEVLLGCLVTFSTSSSTPAQVLLMEDGDELVPASIMPGDSLLVTPPDAAILNDVNDPVTQEERDVLVSGLPGFRVGFDVGLDDQDGDLRDTTLPSFRDPSLFGLKEILGQRPPLPLMTVEGPVRFRNTQVDPAQIPALVGVALDDSGDEAIPYLATSSEAQILGVAQKAMDQIVDPDNSEGGALYPDEVLGNDGRIFAALTGLDQPSTLITVQNLLPVTTAGLYVPHSGVADVRSFDVLLVEVGQGGVPHGAQGILSVGRVEAHTVETPRFVAPTLLGDRIRYRFLSMMSFINRPEVLIPPGLVIRRVGNNTQFDLTTISNGFLVWNDGSLGTTGGINLILDPGAPFAYPANANVLRINVWTAARPGQPPLFIQTIVLDVGNGAPTITGDAGIQALLSKPLADNEILTCETAGAFVTISPVPGPGQIQEDPNIPGQSIALWFTLDVDTTAANGASLSARIHEDRLTFQEQMDLRSTLARDEPNVDGVEVFSTLEVRFVQGETSDAVTVNGSAEVNGGQSLTFAARSSVYPRVGTFDAGLGSVRVMAWEGTGNTAVVTTNPLTFSALASSSSDDLGPICLGTALADATPTQNYRLSSLTVGDGDVSRVLPGDIVVVPTGATGHATTKAGQYLVRHAVAPNSGPEIRVLNLTTQTLPVNTSQGFVNAVFPTVVVNGANTTSTITCSGIPEVQGTPVFPVTGTLYFVRVQDTSAATFLTQNYAVDYVAVDYAQGVFTIDVGTARDFAGGAIFASTLDMVEVGTPITGFDRISVQMAHSTEEALPASLVGHESGISTAVGFTDFQIVSFGGTTNYTFGGVPALVVGAPGANEVGVDAAPVANNAVFQASQEAIVYEEVPGVVYLDQVNWSALHGAALVSSLLPGDRLEAIFNAQAGLFFEPSVPTPVLPYNGTDYRVVDSNSGVNPATLGFRAAASFGEVDPENVSFEVRRIRRFHEVLTKAGEALVPLESLYKMVRTTCVSFGPGQVGLNLTPNPFVMGFADFIPNLQPGDLVRVMEDGAVVESATIEGVQGNLVWLAAPGLLLSPVGKALQIWRRQAPVPHEQSWEELLELMTDQVLLDRTANYTTQTGGVVETEPTPQDPRHLRDTDKDLNYLELGIQEGDLILIDPAGAVQGPSGVPATGQEFGTRPFGDRSVAERTEPTQLGVVPFLAGGPSETDDNRGFYRVANVEVDGLEIAVGNTFSAAPDAPPVVFGEVAPYAVLPTITGSQAAFAVPPGGPGTEGQMDLRPTAFAGTMGSAPNSFRGNLFSLAPFSYRILRPNTLFTEETQELILLMRERTLSMIEAFEAFQRGAKYGSYFVFQRDLHARDLGSPTIPPEGKGVMSNAFVDSIRGLTMISPFANTSDALSILDRRFWIGDTRLDREIPAFQPLAPSYATLDSNAANPESPVGEGRPVLPDRITEVLDARDQLRQARLAWIQARVNRETGTLTQVDRAASQLHKRLTQVRAELLRRR